MMYEDVIRDFAERTRLNLRAIERLETDRHDVYEVTQLVNSTLGLLVFPQQEFVDRIPETPLTELVRDGWPVPTVRRRADRVNNLNQLIRYLRMRSPTSTFSSSATVETKYVCCESGTRIRTASKHGKLNSA